MSNGGKQSRRGRSGAIQCRALPCCRRHGPRCRVSHEAPDGAGGPWCPETPGPRARRRCHGVMGGVVRREDENALLKSVCRVPRRENGSMEWQGVRSVLAGCGAGAVVLLGVWLWPGERVPPSMGPVVVVPVLHGPAPSAASPSGSGRPVAVPAVPGPSRTCSGGRPVPPSPPPAARRGTHGSPDGPGSGEGERTSHVAGDDEKASRAPRGEVDGGEAESSGGLEGDAGDEWDD